MAKKDGMKNYDRWVQTGAGLNVTRPANMNAVKKETNKKKDNKKGK